VASPVRPCVPCGERFFVAVRQSRMRLALLLALVSAAVAQSAQMQDSHSAESFRGISAVSHNSAWASGTHGTYLRTTNAGRTWIPSQVPGASTLDFRAVVAFSAAEAFLMSAGPGDQSRIYHTADAGQHWQLQFTNINPKGFFDSMVFWDPKHGIVLGDPIPDESGKLKFELLITDDGQSWRPIPPAQLPEAAEGEGAFAASNTCIVILHSWKNDHSKLYEGSWNSGASASRESSWKSGPSGPRQALENPRASAPADPNIWFATGGKAARVFHSPDRGKTWEVAATPILHGPESAGIFSIAFRDALHGIIAGGDYKHPKDDGPNLAFTSDGGKTWQLSSVHPQAYFSAVTYDRKVRDRVLLVAQDFLLDLRLPNHPHRITPNRPPDAAFNAIASDLEGGAFVVGTKGSIAHVP
jgi:photosystem II stability/assembly factor-like uncharacterized protein